MALRLGEAVDTYIISRFSRGEITVGTRHQFRGSLQCLMNYLGRKELLCRIRRNDIERWMGQMNVAPATQRLRLATQVLRSG